MGERRALRMSQVVDFKEYKDHDRWLKMEQPKGLRTEGFYACMSISEKCTNSDSFGTVCVLCNQCGRFNEEV